MFLCCHEEQCSKSIKSFPKQCAQMPPAWHRPRRDQTPGDKVECHLCLSSVMPQFPLQCKFPMFAFRCALCFVNVWFWSFVSFVHTFQIVWRKDHVQFNVPSRLLVTSHCANSCRSSGPLPVALITLQKGKQEPRPWNSWNPWTGKMFHGKLPHILHFNILDKSAVWLESLSAKQGEICCQCSPSTEPRNPSKICKTTICIYVSRNIWQPHFALCLFQNLNKRKTQENTCVIWKSCRHVQELQTKTEMKCIYFPETHRDATSNGDRLEAIEKCVPDQICYQTTPLQSDLSPVVLLFQKYCWF